MTVYLDTSDKELAFKVGAELGIPVHNVNPLVEDITDCVVYGESLFDPTDESYRFFHTVKARNGDAYLSNNPEAKNSPMYRGKLEYDRYFSNMITSINYAKIRADIIPDLGVQYIGRTYNVPKYILVMDNKKSWQDEAKIFLNELTPDFWGTVGFVVTNNAKNFIPFFEEFSYSTPLAITPTSVAKLNQVNVGHCELPAPGMSRSYGVTVRALANKRSSELYLEDKSQV